MSILKIEPSAINTEADFSLGSLSVSGNVNIGAATIAETDSGGLAFTTSSGTFDITANTVNFLNTVATTSIAPGGSINTGGGGGGTATDVPKITNIQVTDSSYTVLDDTAIDITGGYVKITGTGFASGCVVMINNALATSTTFVSSTEVRAQLPATAAGTYVIYLVNTDGGVAIRINGITFSTTPAWTTGSSLSGADGTTVSIQLAATGATAYALAAGSSLPGTLTVSSSGLISGVLPSLSSDTTYSFTVNAIDAELQDSPRTFSITITAGDPFFAATTLLLPGSSTTFVRDASTNNFAVGIFGDTRPNNFSPFTLGYYSNFFDGNGDYFTIPYNLELDLIPLTAWTFEAWVYSTSATGRRLFATDGGLSSWNSTNGIHVLIQTSASGSSLALNIQVATGSSTPVGVTTTTTFPINQWAHVAVSISGTTAYIAVNGVVTSSSISTKSRPSSNPSLAIGAIFSEGVQSTVNWIGYISNLRIVKNTALYTTNFTPPTAPLSAVAGTSLLTCQGIGFYDNSANKFTLTKIGNTQFTSFIPYLINSDYRSYGSPYFDGTSDYVAAPTNSAFAFGTGDFTYEAWFYMSSSGNIYQSIIESSDGTYATSIRFGNDGFGNKLQFSTNVANAADIYSCSITQNNVVNNGWNHVALTRQSGTCRAFLNGFVLSLGSGVNPGSYPVTSFTSTHNIGNSNLTIGTNSFTGYISNARVLKGTALYTANFTPPTQPLTAIANTSLLTLQNNQPVNNSAFLDSSSNNLVVARAGNATQGTFSPYSPSGWSNYFDGTGDYLSVADDAAFNLAADNWTIETWFNFPVLPAVGGVYTFVSQWRSEPTPSLAWFAYLYNNAGTYQLHFNYSTTGTTQVNLPVNLAGASSIVGWNHVAFVRSGNSFLVFLNGTQLGSSQSLNATIFNSTAPVWVGAQSSGGTPQYLINGYLSNLRIVKGTAVYTANFTPPTQPLTAIAGTSLLTCADNRFMDESPNNFAITRNGDARVTNFSPFKAQVQTPRTYSAYFDGTGDYLTVPSSNEFVAGGNGFTVEAWVYYTSITNFSFIAASTTGANSYNPYWFIGSSNTGNWRVSWGDAASADLGVAVQLNRWHHVAMVMNTNGSGSFYLNGTSIANVTGKTLNGSSTGIAIAHGGGFLNAQYLVTGYISNLRYVKGTAVYTANFTPPTQPLTAIANTSLLTCQSPTFVDNSTNNFAVTAAGNTQPTTVNPFGSTFANSTGYTAAEYGGSMYFDGTGDYLTVSGTSSFNFGTSNFTLECWVLQPDINAGTRMISALTPYSTGNTGWALYFGAGSVAWFVNGANRIISSTSVVASTWNHLAIVRNNGSTVMYLNGVATGSTYSDSTNYSGSAQYIGSDPTQPYLGYISNLRIVKGTALYTSNFVPPLTPVTPTTNTVLLLNGTAAAITDVTTKNVLETVGDVKISTAVSKFGGSSMYFDGTGDFLTTVMPALGTGSFTVEFWFYPTDPTRAYLILDKAFRDGNFSLLTDYLNAGVFYLNVAGSAYTFSFTPPIVNQWNHIAISRNSSSLRFFLNGVQLGTTQTNSGSVTTGTLYIGGASTTGSGYLTTMGYIQDFRITQGIARYTANFTPPAVPFTPS